MKLTEAQRLARRIMNRHLEGSAIGPAIISSSWEAMENAITRAILKAGQRRRDHKLLHATPKSRAVKSR